MISWRIDCVPCGLFRIYFLGHSSVFHACLPLIRALPIKNKGISNTWSGFAKLFRNVRKLFGFIPMKHFLNSCFRFILLTVIYVPTGLPLICTSVFCSRMLKWETGSTRYSILKFFFFLQILYCFGFPFLIVKKWRFSFQNSPSPKIKCSLNVESFQNQYSVVKTFDTFVK